MAVRSPEEIRAFSESRRQALLWKRRKGQPLGHAERVTDWEQWLTTCFPSYFTAPFAPHHEEFWEHVWSIKPDVRPNPFIAVWPRGAGKSTNCEAATVALGVQKRKYALYVCGTQSQADKHVEAIGAMLESRDFAERYPSFANRMISKYGHSKGWRRNRLTTQSGYTVDAASLEAAIRGLKREASRIDVLILDELDDILDSLAAVARKILILTHTILPAGTMDLATIGVQNLVHPTSIFSQLTNGTADFLLTRRVSGPIRAIDGLTYTLRDGGYVITGGEPTWVGQDIAACQAVMNDDGLSSFLAERQQEVEDTKGGIYEHIEFQHCDWAEVPTLQRIVVWVDPAVTNTDDSDSHGIQADGLGANGKLYRLFSWEGRTSPEDSLKRAILKAMELKAECVGVETDQGGDTWASTYRLTAQEAGIKNPPAFRSAKAGQGHGPKAHRQAQMVAAYERGEIIHVRGTHSVLERALRRFGVRKPYDLADAGWWAWYDLCNRRRWLPVGT
jgi:hypothetical protein